MEYKERQDIACKKMSEWARSRHERWRKELELLLGDDRNMIEVSLNWYLREPPKRESFGLLGWLGKK